MTYDYIIVGGGSAGCVLANRLSEDPNTNVCLLEAGGSHRNPFIWIPALVIALIPKGFKNWSFDTTPQKHLDDRICYQPRGKVLGGSSSINAMIYIRGVPQDYDAWADEGCEGWSFKDVLPYFKKSQHREAGADDFHGQGGELNVAKVTDPSPFNEAFFKAVEEQGLPFNEDFNGKDQEGAGYYEVTQKNGERWSTARAFIDPVIDRPNLTVIRKAAVQKVEFDTSGTRPRAIAVQVKHKRKLLSLKANREIILSAGAFGSPQQLLLSGVGASSKLNQHGIQQVHDLPGVGENLQDHPDYILSYRSKSRDTVGLTPVGFWDLFKSAFKYFPKRRGTLASNYGQSGAFFKIDENASSPDIQLHAVHALVDDHGRNLHMCHGYSMHVCVLRPKSRGSLNLQSAKADDHPLIDVNFMQVKEDFDLLFKGARLTQKIMGSKAFDDLRTEAMYDSDAKDDETFAADIRKRLDTIYHPVGTCKMGHDEMAVVDERLRVHGIDGLRVVDASIMPTLVSGNTNAPTIMIAEKAADMIKQDNA